MESVASADSNKDNSRETSQDNTQRVLCETLAIRHPNEEPDGESEPEEDDREAVDIDSTLAGKASRVYT